jgi:trimeric autotransporter adhesin
VSGGNLYAGGWFSEAGGAEANRIARWDGSEWSGLGSGLNDYVDDIEVLGSDLYACGNFTEAGGIAVNHIAKWDGSSWSAMGAENAGVFRTLAASGNHLYAGGYLGSYFEETHFLAKWNGSSWTVLGSGVNASIEALAVLLNEVYAAGRFTEAGGVSANRIARWNGSEWESLGSGTNHHVRALAVSGGSVYAGGSFTEAGGKNSHYLARWHTFAGADIPSGLQLFQNYPNPFNMETTISYYLPEAGSVTLAIYNVMGREVYRWESAAQPAGYHNFHWNALDNFGIPVSAGIYFCRISSKGSEGMIKMLFLK